MAVEREFAELAQSAELAADELRAMSGESCRPSPETVAEFQAADAVLISGQFWGAGKSTLINHLEEAGRHNIASWTNRDLRPNEVEGIDKCHHSIGEMAAAAASGQFLELEEVRPGIFYATPGNFSDPRGYVKDLELKGALRLREFAPETQMVIPLPPLDFVDSKQVTEWERRTVKRERLHQTLSDAATSETEGRLLGVYEECTRILEQDLLYDPNMLFVINHDITEMCSATERFLANGVRPDNLSELEDHIKALRSLAAEALGKPRNPVRQSVITASSVGGMAGVGVGLATFDTVYDRTEATVATKPTVSHEARDVAAGMLYVGSLTSIGMVAAVLIERDRRHQARKRRLAD